MTKKELEQQNAELLTNLRRLMEEKEKPTALRQFWDRIKPYIIPFVLGMLLGGLSVTVCGLPTAVSRTTLEQKAASGGAAIPFRSGSPSPSLLNSPQENWNEEPSGFSWTSTSEKPSQAKPQADNGQRTSTRYYNPLIRRTR